MQDFHKLRVWVKAHALAIAVHEMVSRFPRRGYATLRNQMIGSAESIPDRIAEGCGAATNLEFARFLDMAVKSTSELENQLERAHGYGVLSEKRLTYFSTEVCDIRKMTWSLRNRVLRSHTRSVNTEPVTEDEDGSEIDDDDGHRVRDG